MKVDKKFVAILGAGIAGLGAALRCRELGLAYAVYEKSSRAGGLLDNFQIDGYRFDHAVHLSFATEEKVRKIFDQSDYLTHQAESSNYDGGSWLKHPAQNNLFPLPPAEKVNLVRSLIERPAYAQPENYEQWLLHQFGFEIASRFPLRYTRKYWKTEAHQLSTSWIGDRVRRASIDEVLLGAFTDDTPNTYYTKEMRYPKFGGYKGFIQRLIDETTINHGSGVAAYHPEEKYIVLDNGDQVGFDYCASSIPLPEIARLTSNIPTNISDAASSLCATSIDLISIGFNKLISTDLWFYIYDEDIFASRAYSPSLKSPDNAPPGCSSLQFEVYTRGKKSEYEKQDLIENTIYALKKMAIAQEEDIAVIHHKRMPYGNVIFDLGMESSRDAVRNYYAQHSLATIGRFGEWDYLWSNQSLLSGYSWINQVDFDEQTTAKHSQTT